MKKIILLLLFFTGISQAQIVDIPDSNFKNKLIELGVDTNTDGEIQESEAAAVAPMLDVSNAMISDLEGIQYFTNVTNLNTFNNFLTSLDLSSNTNLTFLNCRFNDLTSLNVSTNSNLTTILADNNDLTSLELSNHPNLETLWIFKNDLTALDMSNCPALIDLSCGENLLTNLNLTGCTLLQELQCGQNNLTSLDVTSNINLNYLDCGVNLLTALDVSNNIALATLLCYNNNLVLLDCNNNINLTALIITNNPDLATVFIKNGSDESSNMDSGSWLENWLGGNSPGLEYICADDNQVADIQQWLDADVNINSYCNFQPGGDYNTITGNAKYDADNDGCGELDIIIPYMAINLDLDGSSTNSTFFTNTQGQYYIYTGETGTYTLHPNLENPSYYTVSPSPADVIIPIIDNSTSILDFCVTSEGIHPDLEVVIAPIIPARPGFEATYQLVYKNKGNQTLSGEVLFAFDDTVLDFVSSSTSPDTQTTGLLGYNFSDLLPFQNESVNIILSVNSPSDTPPVNIDDVLSFVGTVNPIAGDESPEDNIFDYDQTVVGSYDPNNIICIQGDLIPADMIGEYLHYVINFENTGNSPAENIVVVMDINPEDFDINTLRILNASHLVDINIVNSRVEFIFHMINLDTGGHGNILLKMETIEELSLTDIVSATAAIYFDYNLPIETNEANTAFQILGVNDNEIESNISIFPNPAKDLLTIQAGSNINAVTIYDIQGRTVHSINSNNEKVSVNISNLNQGVYFLKVSAELGEEVKKIIKN